MPALLPMLLVAPVIAACSRDEPGEPTSTGATTRGAPTTRADGAAPTSGGAEVRQRPDLGVGLRLVDLRLDLDAPIAADHVPGSASVVVAERGGRVHEVVVEGDAARHVGTLLDLRERVGSTASERGLLGVAVDPAGDSLVVSYTSAEDGGNRVERYQLDGNPGALSVDPGSRRTLLEVDQPFGNHNGGHVAFGPDGMLYVGIGDGGSGGDPDGNAQDPTTLLGKLLRVDAGDGPLVPGDNPFANGRGGAPRDLADGGATRGASFDGTGDLWLADVRQTAGRRSTTCRPRRARGANLGWDLFGGAGSSPTPPAAPPWATGHFVQPVFTYGGGRLLRDRRPVYRSAAIPPSRRILFADFCGEGAG